MYDTNTIAIAPPIVTSNTTSNLYMFNYTNGGGVAIFNTSTNTYSEIKLPNIVVNTGGSCGLWGCYSGNVQGSYLTLSSNNSVLFAEYLVPGGGGSYHCVISSINTLTNKLFATVNVSGSAECYGPMVASPDGKYLYTSIGGGGAVTLGDVFSVYGLTHNSIYSLISTSLPIATFYTNTAIYPGYGGSNLFSQAVAITHSTQPLP